MAGYLTHFRLEEARTPFRDVVPLPPLKKEQQELLREGIEEEGVTEPIIVDELGNILDGHHRQEIEPDCPFRIRKGLKTDAEKQAYAYRVNANRRQMTTNALTASRKAMQPTAYQLRDEGKSQEQVAVMIGVSRSCVKHWDKARQSGNGQVTISGHAGRPARLSDAEKDDIRARAAAGETQQAIAEDLGIPKQRVSEAVRSSRKPKPQKNKKAKTLSERAMAARLDIGQGLSLKEATERYGLTKHEYQRTAQIVESGVAGLVEAVDSGLLKIATAFRLISESPEAIEAALEGARLEAAKKRHKQLMTKGKKNHERLFDLLERTWVDWGGFEHGVPINSKILPSRPEQLAEVRRLAAHVRRVVNTILDSLDKEFSKCSQKTAAKKTS